MCKALLAAGEPTESVSCTAGCGEWLSTAAIEAMIGGLGAVRLFVRDEVSDRACPVCTTLMKAGGGRGSLFDSCDDHGVWVIAAFGMGFRKEFAPEIGAVAGRRAAMEAEATKAKAEQGARQERLKEFEGRIEELTRLLLSREPRDARELAERIYWIEFRIGIHGR
jgi:hypothetical protein